MTIIYCLGWVDDADDIFYVDPWLTNIPSQLSVLLNVFLTLAPLHEHGRVTWHPMDWVKNKMLSFDDLFLMIMKLILLRRQKTICSSHRIRCEKYSWIFISFRFVSTLLICFVFSFSYILYCFWIVFITHLWMNIKSTQVFSINWNFR